MWTDCIEEACMETHTPLRHFFRDAVNMRNFTNADEIMIAHLADYKATGMANMPDYIVHHAHRLIELHRVSLDPSHA